MIRTPRLQCYTAASLTLEVSLQQAYYNPVPEPLRSPGAPRALGGMKYRALHSVRVRVQVYIGAPHANARVSSAGGRLGRIAAMRAAVQRELLLGLCCDGKVVMSLIVIVLCGGEQSLSLVVIIMAIKYNCQALSLYTYT